MNNLTNSIIKFLNICGAVLCSSAVNKTIGTLRQYSKKGYKNIHSKLNKDVLAIKTREKLQKTINNAIKLSYKKMKFYLNEIIRILISQCIGLKSYIGFKYKNKENHIKEKMIGREFINIKSLENSIKDLKKTKQRKKRRKTLSVLLKRSKGRSRRDKQESAEFPEPKIGTIYWFGSALSIEKLLKYNKRRA